MRTIVRHIFTVAVVVCFALSATTVNAANDELPKSELVVSYDSGHLMVKGVEESTRIEVTNMLGVKVFSAVTANQSKNDYSVILRKGLYIVRVGEEVKRIAVK